MGFMNFIKGQLIEVITWTDPSNDTIVYHFPVQNREVKMGAQLTVDQSQVAIFVNEGKIADIYGPGLYTLTTENMPVLTKLKSWKYGFNSPFKVDIYFVNTKQFIEQKWGTASPILLHDDIFGLVNLRAFGIFSYKVNDAKKFYEEISGTNPDFNTETLLGQLKRLIVSGFTDLLGEAKIPAEKIAAFYDEISEKLHEKLQSKFNDIGLLLTSLIIENISLPEEVQKAVNDRSTLGIMGGIDQYTRFQAAQALRDSANNPGNPLAGAGVGLGTGVTMGAIMGEALRGISHSPASQSEVKSTTFCPSCNASIPSGIKFCPECGKSVLPPKTKCIKCGFEMVSPMKFCPECGASQNQEITCHNCGKLIPAGFKFCPECGTKI